MKFSTLEGKGINSRLTAAVTALLIVLTSVANTLAATPTTTPQQNGASGLSISPLRNDLTLTPGQAGKIDITLKNITGGDITAKVVVRDFQSDNVSGNPKVIVDPNYKSPQSIRNFLIGLGDVPLAVGQQRTISLPVQAPQNAAPGAYFGLITYQAVPAGSQAAGGNNEVALSASVSQLVLITVPGNITERVGINAIHIYKDDKGQKATGLLSTKPPKSTGIELHNFGNGFARPFGKVQLNNSSGKEIYTYEMNGGITRSVMLPNSSRIFVDPIKNIKNPGRYTLVANISYGSGSAILTAKKTFWYIPAWMLIILALILALIVVAVILARRRYKRSVRQHNRTNTTQP